MPDDANAANQDQNDQDTGENKNNENADVGKENASGNEDAGNEEGKGKDTSQESKDNAKAHSEKGTQEEEDDKTEPEVKHRLSPKDYIIQRQQKKIAKLKTERDEEDEKDEEILPEDEELISKVVDKKMSSMAPFLEKTIEKTIAAEDDQEIKDFLAQNPDFKSFEARVRRFIAHPSRRNLPVKSIFYEVAGDKLLKLGADRAREADQKAKETQTGGGSSRAGEGGDKPVFDLSKDEFEAKKEEVRRRYQ